MTQETDTTDRVELTGTERTLLILPVCAGALLPLLLIIGLGEHAPFGVTGTLFQGIAALHVVLHAILLVLTVVYLGRMAVRTSAQRVGGGLALCVVGALLALGLRPVIHRDAFVHHFAIPKVWNEAGRIVEVPWHEWSYYPMNLDLIFAWFLQLGSEAGASLYHLSFLVLTAGVAGVLGRVKGRSNDLALLSAFTALTIPAALYVAQHPLVDLGLSFYGGIGFVALLLDRKSVV